MNLLDRYIFKSVLFTCAAAVGLFIFVLMLGNAIRDLLGPLLSGQIGWEVVAELLLLLLLAVAPFALPMGILTGVLLTFGRLSADSEITAMRAAGLSLLRIARPVLVLGTLGAVAALYVNFEAMPYGRVHYEHEFAAALRANPLSFVVPKTFIRNFKARVVYVGAKEGGVMRDFWLWQLDNDVDRRVTRVVHAESGRFDYDEATNELILVLSHARIETRNARNPEDFSEPPLVASFDQSEPMRFPLESVLGRSSVQQKLKWMTLAELRTEGRRLAAEPVPPDGVKERAQDRMQVALTIQDKINTALAVLTFTLVGIPLGIRVSRRETSASLGVATLLALGYYFLTIAVGWLDRHPEYRPDLLLWLPNVIFVCLGAWLFRRIEKR